MSRFNILSVLPFSLLLTAVAGGPAAADPPITDGACPLKPPFIEYAAKFICGSMPADTDVVSGLYATSINIHNPQTRNNLRFCKKIVVARREGTCPPPGPGRRICPLPFIIEDELPPDFADRVDCPFVQGHLPDAGEPGNPDHIEGFVVIEVKTPPADVPQPVLDVVGKYTARSLGIAGPSGDVSTLDIVVYQPQKIFQ